MRRLAAALLIALAAAPALAETRYDTPWAHVETPAPGPARSIGGPARGCIAGAVALPAEGEGFQVLRRWRNRFWGNPELTRFIARFGGQVAASLKRPVLIGDMSQPRGGPMATGHRSHQMGVDVDILFTLGPMAASAREALKDPPSMLRAGGLSVDTGRFGAAQVGLLRLAAQDGDVARIFVNFRLKKQLCDTLPAGNRAWLNKVRPWAGHDEHFHVRLRCPADSPTCEEQDGVPPGDGCDETLDAWFKPPPPPDPNAPKPPPPKVPQLPAACDPVLNAP